MGRLIKFILWYFRCCCSGYMDFLQKDVYCAFFCPLLFRSCIIVIFLFDFCIVICCFFYVVSSPLLSFFSILLPLLCLSPLISSPFLVSSFISSPFFSYDSPLQVFWICFLVLSFYVPSCPFLSSFLSLLIHLLLHSHKAPEQRHSGASPSSGLQTQQTQFTLLEHRDRKSDGEDWQ